MFMYRCKILYIFLSVFEAGISNESVDWYSAGEEDQLYEECVKTSKVVSDVFCLPLHYRREVPPKSTGPLDVFFKLPVTEISEIDDRKSQITLRLAYKIMWPEKRMLLNTSADWKRGEINIRPDWLDHFWSPDIIIHDLIKFEKPEVMNQVAALEIRSDHSLYYKVRSDITIVCKGLQFMRYPMDTHTCLFKLSSYGYGDKQMKLSGKFSYKDINQRTLAFSIELRSLRPDLQVWQGSSSNYSVYGIEVVLTRHLVPFILSVYLPTAMFVIMSWVSFFIPPDIVQARIVLLLTLCLVLINMFNTTRSSIPVASSVTALEIWFLACIFIVFLSLIEYAIILKTSSRRKQKLEKEKYHKNSDHKMNRSQSVNIIPVTNNSTQQTSDKQEENKPKDYGHILDSTSRFLFPVIFIVFNFLYWGYYTIITFPTN